MIPAFEKASVHTVVCAGGSGTRFWPLSRRHLPKQLLKLDPSGASLLQATFNRVSDLTLPQNRWMVVGREHAAGCLAHMPSILPGHCLVEPCSRNTAAAIALAAQHISYNDPDALMVVLPADHFVAEPKALQQGLMAALNIAQTGRIVTLGIRPSYAETGYGYIECGLALQDGHSGYKVKRFYEKPQKALAEQFFADTNFLWNAGIFVMSAKLYLQELAQYAPMVFTGIQSLKTALPDIPAAMLAKVYESLPNISVDYAVMEKSQFLAVVDVSCGWSDLGSFTSLGAIFAEDEAGNVRSGPSLALHAHGNVMVTEPNHIVALLGVDDMVVVHTKEATLVCPKQDVQKIRELYQQVCEQFPHVC